MSRTYSICCHDCRIELWIGQSPHTEPRKTEGFYLYFGNPVLEAKLREFLWDHKGHRLGFDDDEWIDNYACWSEDDGVWTLEPSVDDED